FALLVNVPVAHSATLFEFKNTASEKAFQRLGISARAVDVHLPHHRILNADKLEMPLAAGVHVAAVHSKTAQMYGRQIWLGSVVNDPLGRVAIAINPNDADDRAMEIQTGGKSYTLMKTFAGYAVLENPRLVSEDDVVKGALRADSI